MKFSVFVDMCDARGITPESDIAFIAALLDGPKNDFRVISVSGDKVAIVDNPPSVEESG